MPSSSPNVLGPITPVRCPNPECGWATHGIPDKYTDSRKLHLAAHRAEEHGGPVTAELAEWAQKTGRFDLSMASQQPTTPLSTEREQEIRGRRAAIVDAPWGSRRDLDGQYTVQADAFVTFEDGFASSGDVAGIVGDTEQERHHRADFIARAPHDIDALLAETERLRARVAELEKAAVEGRAALADLAYDHDDPGTAALGALWLLSQATLAVEAQPDQAAEVLGRHDAAVLDSAADELAERHERLVGEYADSDISGDGPDAVLQAWQQAEDEIRRLAAKAGESR